jgi:hypothetical protein
MSDEIITQDPPKSDTHSPHLPSPPSFGFDQEGYFFLKIHSGMGFLSMLGFVQKAILWLNDRMTEFETRKKDQGLVKPNKGIGRFNIFK